MKISIPKVVFIVLSVLMASNLSAEVLTETTVGSGYQGNLFNDSNSTGDTYASLGMDMKYYPAASIQLSGGVGYSAFANYGDLSNLSGETSFTVIPTRESSAITVALSGYFTMRKFGRLYKLYDQVGAAIGADIGYRLTSWAFLQSSVSYLNNSYTNSDFGSNRGFDLATEFNITIAGSNSFAFRIDYSHRSFDQQALILPESVKSSVNSQEKSDAFDITGVLLRYSRPLSERTGMNLSIGHRQLQVDNDYSVLGYTIDYLSPWADLWEGTNFAGGLKHIFPRQIITELSFAYFEKSFVDVIEVADIAGETYWRDTRDDRLTTFSFSISKPVSLKNGKQIKPSLHLGYRNNQSTTAFFDYEDIQVSFSLKVGL